MSFACFLNVASSLLLRDYMKNLAISKVAAVVLGLATSIAPSLATSINFTGTGEDGASGNALSASATFNLVGNDLSITLQNTGAAATQPGDVLTIVYFNLNGTPNGTPTLTPVSAALGAGSSLINPGLDSGSIGGNWQYLNTSGPHGATAGISTTGFNGQFGPSGNFGTPTAKVDGVGFGIVNGLGSNPNGGLYRTLVNNEVVFDVTLPDGYSLTNITDVGFQYGTSADEPYVTGTNSSSQSVSSVPDVASTGMLLGCVLGGMALLRKKLAKI
jgi:hypothetical protein